MIKYLALVLIIGALFFGIFMYISGSKSASPALNGNQPGLTKAVVNTPDQALEEDLTALDKDLAELESLESTSLSELNGL